LVCTRQNNHTLDALIEYVAYYHILYSGQLETRKSRVWFVDNSSAVAFIFLCPFISVDYLNLLKRVCYLQRTVGLLSCSLNIDITTCGAGGVIVVPSLSCVLSCISLLGV